MRDLYGTIEGDQVRLRSTARIVGDSVPLLFSATVSGDTMWGPIYMGEYLDAKFTAKRYRYPATGGGPILVPGGPPLAN